LPDKAIDLIDEAAAKIKTELHSAPEELDKINRELIHKETERASLTRENDEKSIKKLNVLAEEISELKTQQQNVKKN
jgi:ATP-dependent Clp protease ATP-binding subunit ClpB